MKVLDRRPNALRNYKGHWITAADALMCTNVSDIPQIPKSFVVGEKDGCTPGMDWMSAVGGG